MSAVFFTDRDLGLQFPTILRESGLRVERHADHFAPDCPDAEWLREVARRGWIALTHDRRIRYKPNELAAIVRHRASLLVIIGDAPYATLARAFVSTSDRVFEFVAAHQPPVIGKVYRPSPAILLRIRTRAVASSSGIRNANASDCGRPRSVNSSLRSTSVTPSCSAHCANRGEARRSSPRELLEHIDTLRDDVRIVTRVDMNEAVENRRERRNTG